MRKSWSHIRELMPGSFPQLLQRRSIKISAVSCAMNQWQVLPKKPWILEVLKGSAKTRYVNDKQITDHYAIIPTGQGLGNLRGLSPLSEEGLPGGLPPVFKHLLSGCHLPEIQSGTGTEKRAVFCKL